MKFSNKMRKHNFEVAVGNAKSKVAKFCTGIKENFSSLMDYLNEKSIEAKRTQEERAKNRQQQKLWADKFEYLDNLFDKNTGRERAYSIVNPTTREDSLNTGMPFSVEYEAFDTERGNVSLTTKRIARSAEFANLDKVVREFEGVVEDKNGMYVYVACQVEPVSDIPIINTFRFVKRNPNGKFEKYKFSDDELDIEMDEEFTSYFEQLTESFAQARGRHLDRVRGENYGSMGYNE